MQAFRGAWLHPIVSPQLFPPVIPPPYLDNSNNPKRNGTRKKKATERNGFLDAAAAILLFMVLVVVGGYFGAGWAKNKGVTAMRENIAQSLENSELSEEESTAINSQMERLESAVKSWGVIESLKHMVNLKEVSGEMGNIGFHVILLSYAQYVLPHTPMPEEERAAGRRTLQRFARGLDEGKLKLNEKDTAWELDGKHEGGQTEFDVEKVRAHLLQLKAQADAALIPDEPYDVEIAEKLKAIVDAIVAE